MILVKAIEYLCNHVFSAIIKFVLMFMEKEDYDEEIRFITISLGD